MEGKLLQKLIAVVLVLCLTATNFIFVAASTVYAIAGTSELEGGNVVFEAYFKDDGNKTTQKVANISEGTSLYLGLEIKAGKLQDAKVKIDNANFKIVEENVNNKFVKSINTQNNEIILNEVSYNDSKDGVIEIELPIQFQKADRIDTAYFEMENSISLSGKYINSSENGKDIQSDAIKTNLRWTELETVEIEFTPAIEKIIYLENSTIVQFSLSSTYLGKYFPKETEAISINIPKVNDVTPTYALLVNGDKVDNSEITAPAGSQEISYTNNFVKDGKIKWNESGDVYKLICTYDGITNLEEPISFNATIQKKLFNRDMGEKKTVNWNSNIPKGTIASVDAKATSGNTYKGYMYANSAETTYSEEYNMEISNVNGITATLELQEDYFKTENGGTLTTNGQTEYKEIIINKEKLVKILGANGQLSIKPENSDLSEIIVDSTSSADENGNIVISYDRINGSHNVVFEITNAANEGTLKINVQKAIKGNAGHDKDTLKTINAIETVVKSYTNGVEGTSTATATTQLKETVTEATISMNNNNILSTTTTNDIEFIATLKTGTMDTDLLKAPTIRINLPEEVAATELTSVSALYAEEELNISSADVTEDGKAIIVKLDGEQLSYNNKFIEGIKVTINAKITLKDTATSRDTNIEMKYTNENSAEKEFTATTPVSIQAPYGLVTKALIKAEFETQTSGVQTLTTSILNNHEKSVESIAIIGTIANDQNEEEFEKTIKENFKTTLDETNIEINYSQDGKNFEESFENAKYFKVTISNSKLEVGESIGLSLKENVTKILTDFKLAYVYDGIEKVQELKIDKITSNISELIPSEEVEPTVNEESKDPLDVKLIAKTASSEVKDNDEVAESQPIRYTYIITNNTNTDMNNVKFVANHENVNIYEYVKEEQPNSLNPGENTSFTIEKEVEDKSKYEYEIEKLEAGKSEKVTYQVRVKENATKISSNVKVTADDVDDVVINTSNTVKNADLKLELSSNVAQEYPVSKDSIFQTDFTIKNISDTKLENITVNFTIPKAFEYDDINEVEANNNYTVIQKDRNLLIFNIKELAPGATKTMTVSLKSLADNATIKTEVLKYTAQVNNSTYYSNEAEVGVIAKNNSKFETQQTTNISEDTLKTGDKLTYTIRIKNVSDVKDVVMVDDSVPEAAVVKKAYYTVGEETTEIENITDNTITEHISLGAGEETTLNIETEIDESKTGKEKITNYATVIGNYSDEAIKTEEVTYKLQANIKENGEGSEGTDTNPEDDQEISEDTDSNVDVKQSISGLAWVDENKNGIREDKEKPLAGIKVSLANVETGKYVADSNGDKLEVTTNENGEYKFENISSGKYMVVFTYDNTKYRNTEYRVKSATEKTNSDIITSKLSTDNDDIIYGVTDTLELKEESLENIDAGFIENEIFDLSLNKYITKVTVQNSSGTVVKEYSKEQLAKIEIDSKNLAGSTVLVEYEMEVKNEGEIAGYANEIVDYIPKDLTFSSEMNKDWYISTDGNLHTTALSKTLIEPGETQTIKLVLVKTMTENNTGLTSNKAEIAKSSNDLSIPDKDSKAGNSAQAEDDISTAEVIISIRTGVGFTIGIITAIIAITATGIIVYTKKRKEVSHE